MFNGLRDRFPGMFRRRTGSIRVQATAGRPDRDDKLIVMGVLLFAVVGALWIVIAVDLSFGGSDVLVPVFASLYRWTPFYWGQTRFGMVIPLLTAPISSPVANLVTQRVIGHVLALLLPFLLARWLLGPRRWFVAGALGATTMVLALGPYLLHFLFAGSQPYIASATTAVAGAVLLDSARFGRRIAGWLLLAVAFWITPSTLFWLAPMLVLCGLTQVETADVRRTENWALGWRLALVSGLALALAWSGRLVSGVTPTPLGLAPAGEWPATWWRLSSDAFERLPAGWPVVVAAVPCGLALLEWARRAPEATARSKRVFSALCLGAAAQIVGAGALSWVAQAKGGLGGWRFAIPSIVFALLAPPLAAAAFLPEEESRRAGPTSLRGWITLLLLALPLVVLALKFGAPSPARDLWEPADWSTARIAVLRNVPAPPGNARPRDFESDRRRLRLPELELIERGELFEIYRGRGAAPAL